MANFFSSDLSKTHKIQKKGFTHLRNSNFFYIIKYLSLAQNNLISIISIYGIP